MATKLEAAHEAALVALRRRRQELDDQAWWIKRLGIGCLVLTLGIGGFIVDVYVLLGRQEAVSKAAFKRGLDEGLRLRDGDLRPAAPSGRPQEIRGPLDLTKLTSAQIQGLRCYIQDRPTNGLP